MVRLVRDRNTGAWKSRKVIPLDVREAYGKANETPTWPATLTEGDAKAAWSRWLAEVEGRIERLRRLMSATPTTLTHREIHALAGAWYSDQVQQYEDDPGSALSWEGNLQQVEADDEEAAYEAYRRGEEYDGAIKRLAWLEDQADEFLQRRELVLTPASRQGLLDRVHELYPALCRLMIRRAAGDYSEDPLAHTLPPWTHEKVPVAKPPAVSISTLFERYVDERKPSPATVKAFRRHVEHLKGFLGHDDAARVAGEDIVRWKDELLSGAAKGPPRSAKTVRDTYLAAAKTVFGYGVENRLLATNPVAGITVRGPRVVRVRDRGLTDEEAKIILRGTEGSVPASFSSERRAALRWIPWLCAYTGARVNEMTQLRKQDVFRSEGVWVIRITPEAGSTKTGRARDVPLHSHLVDQGFLTFVERANEGPLFYNPGRARGGTEGNPQSKKVGEALARWVRSLGVTDENVAPNHGWRHRFETEMRKAGVDHEARHALVGHAFKTESGSYGHWSADALSREIEKLPRYASQGSESAPAPILSSNNSPC